MLDTGVANAPTWRLITRREPLGNADWSRKKLPGKDDEWRGRFRFQCFPISQKAGVFHGATPVVFANSFASVL